MSVFIYLSFLYTSPTQSISLFFSPALFHAHPSPLIRAPDISPPDNAFQRNALSGRTPPHRPLCVGRDIFRNVRLETNTGRQESLNSRQRFSCLIVGDSCLPVSALASEHSKIYPSRRIRGGGVASDLPRIPVARSLRPRPKKKKRWINPSLFLLRLRWP